MHTVHTSFPHAPLLPVPSMSAPSRLAAPSIVPALNHLHPNAPHTPVLASHAACATGVFNNIAVAAAHALEARGLSRVAIVDFDVHHGERSYTRVGSGAQGDSFCVVDIGLRCCVHGCYLGVILWLLINSNTSFKVTSGCIACTLEQAIHID